MSEPRKTVAVVQSCYIPWKGYFDLINVVDEFILYDDVQYTRRDWRNRNLIKTPQGPHWLTIPVQVKGKYTQRIDEVMVSDPRWGERHWKSIVHNYSSAPYFGEYRDSLEELYFAADELHLSKINRRFLEAACDILGISTTIAWSTDYEGHGRKTERLVDLCAQAGASHYLSGPAALGYLDEDLFAKAGLGLSYMDYAGYPEYPQLFPPFD